MHSKKFHEITAMNSNCWQFKIASVILNTGTQYRLVIIRRGLLLLEVTKEINELY